MANLIVSIRVRDFGEYHNSIAKLKIQRSYEGEIDEVLFIRYGYYNRDSNFLPCTIILHGDQVFLQKAGVGKLGDVKINAVEWLKILKALGSTILFKRWSELINYKKVA